MKKITILAIVAVFFVVACQSQKPSDIVVIEYLDSPNVSAQNATPVTNDCLEQSEMYLRDTCFINEAKKKGDFEICGKITDYLKKTFCYQFLANTTQNQNICTKITVDYDRDSCYYNIALTKKDHVLCRNVVFPERKDDCYLDIAVVTDEKSVCKIIEDQEAEKDCYKALNVTID